MIPRHRPPFDVRTVIAALLSGSQAASVERVERRYAESFDLYAVLVPSARAGICWALRAAVDSDTRVIGPAYTCQVVHEAMARSGAGLRLVDSEGTGFLMDPTSLAAETAQAGAVVLSEIYGYSYESYGPANSPQGIPSHTVIDAAMTIPVPQFSKRVQGAACVIFSFGIGKCLYSGTGGIVLTRDKRLADELRRQRQARLSPERLALTIMRAAEIIIRTVAHTRPIYGILSYKRDIVAMLRRFKGRCSGGQIPLGWCGDQSTSREWRLPSTYVDRWLMMHNFERIPELYGRRITLSDRYHRNLAGVAGLILPSPSFYAMSHYTIRVPTNVRDAVQTALRHLGVDAGTLFPLPPYLSGNRYPNAAKIAGEVLNLPLDATLTYDDVDYICDCLILCLSRVHPVNTEPDG